MYIIYSYHYGLFIKISHFLACARIRSIIINEAAIAEKLQFGIYHRQHVSFTEAKCHQQRTANNVSRPLITRRLSSIGSDSGTALASQVSTIMPRHHNFMLSTNSHLNPCSEPNINDSGKFARAVILVLSVCLIGTSWTLLRDHFFNNSYDDSYFRSELNGIKHQIGQMKENVQFVLKTKEDTRKIISDMNKLFSDLKRAKDTPPTIASCGVGSKPVPPDDNVSIQKEIEKFNADKTGQADYALESAGASIHTVRDTEDYNQGMKITLFGWTLCSTNVGARTILQPNVSPGECWAFKGSHGAVIIRLLHAIYITGVTMEHIPKSISPSEDIRSAPYEFSIWGLTNPDDRNSVFLSRNYYDINDPPVQYFPVQVPVETPFVFVELRIHSNYGEPDYTCVYRIRVHGSLKRLEN